MLIPIYRLTQCALAMPKRDPRKILKGIFLKREAGQMTMCATDGKVMLEHKFSDPGVWPDWLLGLQSDDVQPDLALVLSGETVNEILKVCKASEFVFLTEPQKTVKTKQRDGTEVEETVLDTDAVEIKYVPDPRSGKKRLYSLPAEIVDGKFPDYRVVLNQMEEKILDPSRRPVSITLGNMVMPFLLELAKQWGESANDDKANYAMTLVLYPEKHRTEHWEPVAIIPRDAAQNGRGLIMPIRTDVTKAHEPIAHYWTAAHAPYADPVQNPAVPVQTDGPNYTDPEAAETYQAVVRDNGMNDIETVEDDGPLTETGGTPGAVPL